ncbi:glycosyltransferase [Shewanella corallii]|uniref:Glycosyltransferase n=1 Tax=Shewanella corallii TaxID=560080 RepID=A0ABT0N5L1_9GAMM|nr:glycosyltransferase [Shewanella corallii]MCL2913171.1 glycosyltransferase [Shewanella corallii]
MKVLHIITGLGSGGAENMLYKIIKSQAEHEHLVISINGGGEFYDRLIDLNVMVLIINKVDYLKVFPLYLLRKKVSNFSPDVIMSWMYHSFIFSFIFKSARCNIWNVRHSLSDLSKDKLLTRIVIKLTSLLSSKPDFICFNSIQSLEQHKLYGYNNNLRYIPNGFDIELFGNYSYSSDVIKFTNFSRYHPVKGIERLIHGFLNFVEVSNANAELHLYGTGISQEKFDLSMYSSSLINRVIFNGKCDFVPATMYKHDVYILSSYSEAFPNVIGEALLSGLFVISTDVGDASKIIRQGEDGVLISSESFDEEFYDALICSLNYIRNDTLRHARHKYVAENFSIQQISENYNELYEGF